MSAWVDPFGMPLNHQTKGHQFSKGDSPRPLARLGRPSGPASLRAAGAPPPEVGVAQNERARVTQVLVFVSIHLWVPFWEFPVLTHS